MKKYIFSFAALIMLLAVCSCNKEAFMDASSDITTRADENPWDVDFADLDTTYFVSDKDVESYIHFKELVAEGEKREFEVREVVPLGLNDEATLAYLINYNEGWEIIAADKRAPTVLASGDHGNINIKEVPDNMMAWIQNLERDVLFLRDGMKGVKSIDEDTWQNIQSSIDFWACINVDQDYFASLPHTTRSMGELIFEPDTLLPRPVKGGHWELVETWDIVETLYSTGRLTVTNFDQEYNYNSCCPLVLESYGDLRCKAGCVAVAGAQMAYYLHYELGRPLTAPAAGYCNSYAYTRFGGVAYQDPTAYSNIHTYAESSTVWDQMQTNPNSASYLIAEIGKRIRTLYGVSSSGAKTFDLKDDYFSTVGIDCDTMAFSSPTVFANLEDNLPVIVTVQTGNPNDNHACICDGYQRNKRTQKGLYTWVRDSTNIPVPLYEDEIRTIRIINPEYLLHINWGYGAAYNGSGSWYLESGNWNIGDKTYHIRNSMICNFSLSDNL